LYVPILSISPRVCAKSALLSDDALGLLSKKLVKMISEQRLGGGRLNIKIGGVRV
jgi:hypothetical protein